LAEPTATASGARAALLILFAINLLNFFDRQLLGGLGEAVRKEFMLNDTALGLLGTVFTLMYAVVGLPIGRLTDRVSRRRLIAAGVTLWSLLTAATGFAQNYTQIFVARLGVGLGEATCAPAGQSLIGDFYPPHRRTFAMGVFMLGLPCGIFLAYLGAGYLYEYFGWRSAFYFACVPGLVLAALALCMREPARGALDTARHATASDVAVAAPFASVLSLPTMWWIILSGIFHNFNMYAINSFNTPFLMRFHEMSLRAANNASSLAVGLVGAIGLLGGGWIADRLSVKRRNARLLLAAWCMAFAAPCIFLAIDQPQGAIGPYIALMALGTITMYVYYATVYTAIQDVIEPRLRGTAVAIYFCCMYVFGASLGPVATGMLSDHFARAAMHEAGVTAMTEGFKATGLHHAMYAVPILAILAALVLFAAAATVERDARKQLLMPAAAYR
jgi:MFS family permease